MSGVKFDNDKARFDLVPPEPIEELTKLFGIGAVKYGANNWKGGMEWGRIYSALLRHLFAFWKGEDYDPVDGQHHLIAVMWNALVLYYYRKHNLGTDNRAFIEGDKKDA